MASRFTPVFAIIVPSTCKPCPCTICKLCYYTKQLAPSGSKCSDKHLPTANSQTCRGFAEGRALSYRVLRGKDKSFPYRGVCAYLSDLAGIKAFSAALTLSLPQQGIGVKLTITGDFKQSKQQKQAKSKDVFALKKHKTNEAFQVKKSSYQHESSCGAKQSVRNIQPLIPAITTSAR